MKREIKNIPASVRARLLNVSRTSGERFAYVLVRHALEGLLARLDRSRYRREFILKGAMAFRVWSSSTHRHSKDLDLLSSGTPDPERLRRVFTEIVSVPLPADGLVFDASRIEAAPIKTGAKYRGVRLKIPAQLGDARLALQVDVGFGDVVQPVEIEYPRVQPGAASAKLLSYPMATVVAEKVQAMTELGLANTRMKDFYDVWWLATHYRFSAAELGSAIRQTFARRGTAIPSMTPVAWTRVFTDDSQKLAQWKAFLAKSSIEATPSLSAVVAVIRAFVSPVLTTLHSQRSLRSTWRPELGVWV